jgi:hypothetical protein
LGVVVGEVSLEEVDVRNSGVDLDWIIRDEWKVVD